MPNHRRFGLGGLLAFLLTLGSLAGSAADSVDHRLPAGPFDLTPILAEGEPAPGRGELVVTGIREVVTNSSGKTAVSALVDGPSVGADRRLSLIFLADGQGTRAIPGLEAATADGGLEINERGTVAIFDGTELTVADEGGPIFAVKPGDPAPVAGQTGGAPTFQQVFPIKRTLNNNDEIGFRALLSDGRLGVFRASSEETVVLAMAGDDVSGRPGEVVNDRSLNAASHLLDDGSMILGNVLESSRILAADGSAVTSVASTGDRLDSGLVIETIRLLDAHGNGRLVLVANRHHLLVWEAGRVTPIVGPDDRLPGFPAGAVEFRDGFVMAGGAVYFTAVVEPLGGIFLWDQRNVVKVAVDGDRTPAGDSFQVSLPPSSFGPFEREFFGFPRPGSTFQAAFSASTGALVWRAGGLLSVDLAETAPDDETSPLIGVSPMAADSHGGILMRGSVCCFEATLFRAEDARPRVRHLPYLAAGNAGLRFRTTVEALNLSPFPALVSSELFDSTGNPLPTSGPLILPPGSSAFSIYQPRLVQGFAQLTIENGARVAFSDTIETLQGSLPLSRVTIPQQSPRREAEFVFDGTVSQLALALSNPGPEDASIEVQLLNAAGSVTDRTELSLPAHRQMSGYLSDLLGSDRHRGPGRLLLSAGEAFLVTLLKQFGPHLAYVPPIEDRTSEADWGFVNLFPSEDRFRQVLANARGNVAFTTDRPELWLATGGEFVQLLPESVFPPESASSSGYERIELREFNERGQILLAATRAGSQAEELLLWGEEGPRKLADIGVGMPEPPSALNDLGLVALGGPRLTLIGDDDVEEVAVESPALQVSLNRRGDVVFVDADGVALYADRELTRIAEPDRLPEVGSGHRIELSGPVVNERRQVVFRASWRVDFQTTRTALFSSLGNQLRPLLMSGLPLPDLPEWTVEFIGEVHFDPDGNLIISANVENAQSQRSVAVLRSLETEPGLETLFVADPASGLRAFFDVSSGSDGSLALLAFETDFSLSAWFWDTRELRPLLRPGDRVAGQRGRPDAFVSRVQSVRILETGEVVTGLELIGALNAGIFLGSPDFRESIIPLMAEGRFGQLEYRSRLMLANRGASPASARIEYFSTEGAPFGQPETVDLAPGATRSLAPPAGESFFGWLRIEGSAALAPLLHLSASETTSLRTEVFLEAAPLRGEGRFFSFSTREADQDTAAVFVNPFARTAVIELEVSDFFGRTRRRQLEIPAGGQATFLHSRDLAPFTGTLRASGVFPLPFTALRITHQIFSGLPTP